MKLNCVKHKQVEVYNNSSDSEQLPNLIASHNIYFTVNTQAVDRNIKPASGITFVQRMYDLDTVEIAEEYDPALEGGYNFFLE